MSVLRPQLGAGSKAQAQLSSCCAEHNYRNASLAALGHSLTACNAAPPSMPPMSTYTPQIKKKDQISIVLILLNKVFNPSNFLFAFPLSLGTPKSKNIDHFSIVIWALGATFAINKFFDRSNFSFAFPHIGTPKSNNRDHFSIIINKFFDSSNFLFAFPLRGKANET